MRTDYETALDAFIRGAWTAMLFTAGLYSDNPNSCAEYGPGNVPDVAKCLRSRDLAKFMDDCASFLTDEVIDMIEASGRSFEDAGTDFTFTRNRVGVGFWDGDWGDHGRALTAEARPYGSFYLATGSEDDPDSGEAYRDADGYFDVWS